VVLDIIIVNSAEVPIYEQITRQIKDEILKGELKEGDLLPSVRVLAKDLNISVITTRRAYDELENQGFTVNMTGKGTFVAPQNLDLLKESRYKIIEEKLAQAVDYSKSIGVSKNEVIEIVELLFEEGK
jgi:GntR family transcriptional regulator